MTKDNLIKLLFPVEEQKFIDVAVPQSWSDKVKELGVDPFNYVWDYRNDAFGKPLNILETYATHCIKEKEKSC